MRACRRRRAGGNEVKHREIAAPPGYDARILRPPFDADLAGRVIELLGHKGEPWLADIQARLEGQGLDLFALAFRDDRPVANVWLGSSHRCPEVGLVGHVFTVEEHRRRGLAGTLLRAVLEEFDRWGGRWALLSTANEAAARIYERVGFRTIRSRQSTDAAGRRLVHREMLRGGGPEGVGERYFDASGRWRVVRYDRSHWPALRVLFNAVDGSDKLPSIGIDTGLGCGPGLLEAYEAQQRGECACWVLTDDANGRPHGMACAMRGRLELYAPRAPEPVRAMFEREISPGA